MFWNRVAFVNDLREALRCGMIEAVKHYPSLQQVDVKGVERTLYPIIREYALKHLESIGYADLTSRQNFFVIGDSKIEGANKLADGFICDPIVGKPVYAIEVGIDGPSKFWDDFKKCVNEWSKTSVIGAFILFLNTQSEPTYLSGNSGPTLYSLDGSTLFPTLRRDYAIYPLIASTDPGLQSAMESTTNYMYFERHRRRLFFNMLTLSDRTTGSIVGKAHEWTTNVMLDIFRNENRFLHNMILNFEEITSESLRNALDDEPELIVLQGYSCPFHRFSTEMRQLFENYVNKRRPRIVIFGDWMEEDEWNSDSTMKTYLPVKLLGRRNAKAVFGTEIITADTSELNLRFLYDPLNHVGGFERTELMSPSARTHMKVQVGDDEYPFVVSSDNIVFIASGVGGWGKHWYSSTPDSFRELWMRILNL